MLGLEGDLRVTDINFERELNLQVALRAASLGKVGGLPMTPYEKVLLPHLGDETISCEVPAQLIAGTLDFRESWWKDMQKKRAGSLEHMLEVLVTGWDDYKQSDRWLIIEKAILEKVRYSVVRSLPSSSACPSQMMAPTARQVIACFAS